MEFINCRFHLPPHKHIDVKIRPNRGSTDHKAVSSKRKLNRIVFNVRNMMKLEPKGGKVVNSRGRERGIRALCWEDKSTFG